MEDDDINIDFSKVKRWLGKAAKALDEEESQESPQKTGEKAAAASDVPNKRGAQDAQEKPAIPSGEPQSVQAPETPPGTARSGRPSGSLSSKSVEEEEMGPAEEEEDISIDFSKMKSWFRGKDPKDRPGETAKETVKSSPSPPEKKEDEDDLAIDFSKMKSFFRGKSPQKDEKAPRESPSKEEKGEDELSLDFSQVKAFFRGLFRPGVSGGGFGKWVGRYQVVLLLIIAIIFTVSVRMIPSYLPITEQWAGSTIENNVAQQIAAQIRGQYPNLPQQNIDGLVEQQMQAFRKENKAQIAQQQEILASQFRERLQLDGQTYLVAIDPYYWMLHAERILENGHPGDTLRNPQTLEECFSRSKTCVPWDDHMFAPLGREVPPDMLHAYVGAYAHKVVSAVSPRTQLMTTMFYLPVILSALFIIPAFFIARRLSGNLGGFIAAFLTGIHPSLLTRTVAGFSDTDGYNVLFPLYIIWLFLASFDAKSWKKGALLAGLAGLLIGIYPLAWGGGWWYIFDFILGALAVFFVSYLIIHRDEIRSVWKNSTIRRALLVASSFFASSALFTTLFVGFSAFTYAFRGPMDFISLKEIGITSVWPNVFTTVAEQNPATLQQVIGSIGLGKLGFIFLAILGIALTLTRGNVKDRIDRYFIAATAVWLLSVLLIRTESLLNFLLLISVPIAVKLAMVLWRKRSDIDIKLAIILIIWFIATMYASVKGVRYLLLLVPAFSIGVGISFGLIYQYLSGFLSRELHLNERMAKAVLILFLLLFMIPPFSAARQTAVNEIPSMNDAWYTSLDRINLLAAPDAVINSWWDYGHWFKAIGDRAVTFDGTSQNTPMAHWIGSALLTDDEEESVGILRMLDCGSNTAFTVLDADIKDTARSVQILHEIVRLSRSQARQELLKWVEEEKADEVLEFTHCVPPENYFITSDDMIGKAGVWAHFGSWDFDRALIYNKARNMQLTSEFVQERFSLSQEEADRLVFEARSIRSSTEANNWIAPWPGYASGLIGCSTQDNRTLSCPMNSNTGVATMEVNLITGEARIPSPSGYNHPNALVMPTEEGISKRSYTNSTIGYSAVLIPTGQGWGYILMQPPLEDSMFTRLFLMEGHGLTHFTKFSDEQSVIGNRIVVWKVDWNGSAPLIAEAFAE